jgi:hypothetical protein
MSRWAETFAALSRGIDTVDRSDTSATATAAAPIVSRSAHSVTTLPESIAEELRMPPPSWSETKEEPAATVEIEAGVPREWAEGFARLHHDRPPGDVPAGRWQTFIDDIVRFLDQGWADKAAALGWGPYDLFGCDRDTPFSCLDQAGLLWLIDGGRLVAIAENAATIELRVGARQTWRRKPVEPGRVLVWDLAQRRDPRPNGPFRLI